MNAPDRAELRDLAAAYALGALDQAEASAFEAAMQADPTLVREVTEYREVQALLAGTENTPSLPSALKDRVMARVTREKTTALPTPTPGRRTEATPRWAWLSIAAAVLAVVGAGVLFQQSRQLRSELEANRQDLARVQEVLTEREATLATLLDAERELTVIQLVAAGPQAPGMQLFWNRRTNTAVLHAFRLPPAPSGQVYQLWLIRDGVPVPSQLFTTGADGSVVLAGVNLPPGDGVSAAAVTLEPAGGSAQPTTPILLVGALPTS
ncbi:MAG: anti-sigma factor [Gemmatimonadota bacterium]|nr:anti-sigma factor [Gemmatimonadota bacterium]